MVPPGLNFWSIWNPNRSMHLEKGFCEHYCVQTTISIPGTIKKMLKRKRTSILGGVCFIYEQLSHPVQCTSCRKCQCRSKDKFVLPEVTGILKISDQLHYP